MSGIIIWSSKSTGLTGLAVALVCLQARAQSAPEMLTVRAAVDAALRNYPSIQVSQEQLNGAAAGIALARTAYLPHIDTLAQVNRASRNNVFGTALPQSVIPSLSGPVIGSNNFGSAWGSAVGGLVTWEPFDFGLRQAGADAAGATRAQAAAALKRTEFEVAVATADAFLTLTAAQEMVRAAQAGVDRAEVTQRSTAALVGAELRPGADASRSEAELAAARSQWIQAQQATAVARASLARFTGGEPERMFVATGPLLQLPPDHKPAPLNAAVNPASLEQSAVVEQARAQLRILERSYFPRFYLQGSVSARGTGAETNGNILGGVNGLAPTVQNYALGLTVSFPVMDKPAIQARESAQASAIKAQEARARQIATDLKAQWNAAVATLEGARRLASNVPTQVAAAKTASVQATARYQAGFGTITDVAEAQRLLTQAEIDEALAKLSVWRGLLAVATAAGDLQPFLSEASQ
jgi:outer membrane protein